MCLTQLKKYNLKTHIGYKVFQRKGNSYYSFKGEYKFNKTTEDKETFEIRCGVLEKTEGKYETGFHLFSDLETAKQFLKFVSEFCRPLIICKVRFSKVVAFGDIDAKMQNPPIFKNVVVAKKITIIGKVKKYLDD